jgi:hypothetical protein
VVGAVVGSGYTGYQVGYAVAETWDENQRKEQQQDEAKVAAYLDEVENVRAEEEYRQTHPLTYRMRQAQAEKKQAGAVSYEAPFVVVDPEAEGSFDVDLHALEHIEEETGTCEP